MSFHIVDSDWNKVFHETMHLDTTNIQIVCPFIKSGAISKLLARVRPKSIQVITRFNPLDFYNGASDISALRFLLNAGAEIRGVRNLHAKLYLFDGSRAVVTSANLTNAALHRNHELGFVSDAAEIVSTCCRYFCNLWARSGQNLTAEKLVEWESKITLLLATGKKSPFNMNLEDEGVDLGILTESWEVSPWIRESRQAFVKFFGESHKRIAREILVAEEVQRSGCHWACAYPKGKRPRQVHDGAIMFMGRMVRDPDDTLIYGRAIGMQYQQGRDDASASDIELRPWKEKWPHYVRVHHAEFVGGMLSNGVSLNELKYALGKNAFAVTQRNAVNNCGNTNPNRAYQQQAAVELSPQGMIWMNDHLEGMFSKYGKLTSDVLERLDCPTFPSACHEECLAAAHRIVRNKGRNQFLVQEILNDLRTQGTRYSDQTIRTHITSRCCENAPAHHDARYKYFRRISQGCYELSRHLRINKKRKFIN